MGEVGRLIQAYKDSQKFPPSSKQLAELVGVSRSAFQKWERGMGLPAPENLRALARVIEAPYSRVLDAALVDAGYHEPRAGEGREQQPAAKTEAPQGRPQRTRRRSTGSAPDLSLRPQATQRPAPDNGDTGSA